MIAGLEETTGGTIRIGGRVVNDLEPRERGCAMVFQNYALYPHMSVADNIGYALKVAGMPRTERLERVLAVASSVEIEGLLDRKPGQLSGGQRQRVAMARAMVREPQVFLFDEPFSNLDAKLRVAMRAEVRRLHRALGVTSVFVTHDQTEAMTLADRLIIMNAGRVEQIGAPMEVYDNPASIFVAGFIGSPAMNFLPGTVRGGMLDLGDGVSVPLPDALRAKAGEGAAITFGIRPEHLQIDESGMPFVVENAEALGADSLIHGKLGAHIAVVRADGHVQCEAGAQLKMLPAANKFYFFDTASGRRM